MLVSGMDDQGLIDNVHDLTDYSFALEVMKSHPKIISVYTKLIPVLYNYAQFQCVWPVITLVEDSLLLAKMQESYYRKIFESKGRITDGKKTSK